MEFQNFDLKKIKTLNYEEQKNYISKYLYLSLMVLIAVY